MAVGDKSISGVMAVAFSVSGVYSRNSGRNITGSLPTYGRPGIPIFNLKFDIWSLNIA